MYKVATKTIDCLQRSQKKFFKKIKKLTSVSRWSYTADRQKHSLNGKFTFSGKLHRVNQCTCILVTPYQATFVANWLDGRSPPESTQELIIYFRLHYFIRRPMFYLRTNCCYLKRAPGSRAVLGLSVSQDPLHPPCGVIQSLDAPVMRDGLNPTPLYCAA